LLWGGLAAFGAAVALIDQIYNAHPDSYRIFLVWLVPALLFALLLRRLEFVLLTYVLAHLALWLYFFPTGIYMAHSDGKQALIYGLFAAANLVIFLLAETGRFHLVLLRRVSLI